MLMCLRIYAWQALLAFIQYVTNFIINSRCMDHGVLKHFKHFQLILHLTFGFTHIKKSSNFRTFMVYHSETGALLCLFSTNDVKLLLGNEKKKNPNEKHSQFCSSYSWIIFGFSVIKSRRSTKTYVDDNAM